MAALPSPTQVAGNHNTIYESYYNVVDPIGIGSVGGMEAARFLKRSGLSDVVLSRIWDLSDPGGRGFLDKTGMFVALKLVALVQNGEDLNISNVNKEVPPPKMGDLPLNKPPPVKPPPPPVISNTPLITSLPVTAVDWTVKPSEREKYDKLFDSLQPVNGLIPGNKVKNVLLESKLPCETLVRIWDLADQDNDGMLDRHEFVAAMHLVYKALEKYAIPNTLPAELMPPPKRKNNMNEITPSILSQGLDGVKPDIPPLPPVINKVIPTQQQQQPQIIQQQQITKPIQPVQATMPWVVTADEKATSDALFLKSDTDKDGFVSGHEIKDVFLQSGLQQAVLAHIWALCDIKQCGKLNNEQFALAMWFIAKSLKGNELPSTLHPMMIPPSFRTTKPSTDALVENNNTRYSNPELDMISKDLEELAREKLALETDIAQKEADTKIKSGEIKSLQSELDTLAATLKQLENQKGEAQKRLNDLRAQKSEINIEMEKIDKELDEEIIKVDKLRIQAAEQAETVAEQEAELNTKKEQLDSLRKEEQRLEQEKSTSANKLANLTTNLQDTQLGISQAKALITQLEEQTRQMNDAIEACNNVIDSGDANSINETVLRIKPDFRDSEYTKLTENRIITKQQNGFDNSQNDPFSNQNGPVKKLSGQFNDDPFKNDPFKNSDAFTSNDDAFSSAFSKSSNDAFGSDPFGGSAFPTNTTTTKEDPFDAFGDSRKNSDATAATEADKDPFGCDPFAILHAPTRDSTQQQPPPPRPTSPSPALPPKKSKQPPPRPAPPRPLQPPNAKKQSQPDIFDSSTNNNDPFSSPTSGGGGGGGFADFTDFDSKFSNKSTNKVAAKSQTTTTTTKTKTATTKGMEFTDDPFRDYRYEDPFNIKFDDDDDANDNVSTDVNKNKDAFGFVKTTTTTNNNSKRNDLFNNFKQDKFDPFGLDGRQSVPLPIINESFSISGRSSVPLNTKLLNEDQQLAWAARESLKLEEVRKKRQLQEQADLELAISLSKVENKKKH